MDTKENAVKPDQVCDFCTKGKFSQTRSREPDIKAKKPLEVIHSDLADPMKTTSIVGYKYTQSFTDDYSVQY